MNRPDPLLRPTASDARDTVAELLGRIMARYWVTRRSGSCNPQRQPGPRQPPKTG